MINVAWIGEPQNFYEVFGVDEKIFYNTENDMMYYCISRYSDIVGRRFDKIEMGWKERDDYKYYKSLFEETESHLLHES